MVGRVEVGRAGGEEPALGAGVVEQQRLLARVGDVEDLDAVEAVGPEGVDRGDHRRGVVDVPERVRPHGHPARRVDDADRLGDGRAGAADVRRRTRHEVGREEGVAAVDALLAQALGVRGVGEHRVGEVRAAQRQAGVPALGERAVVELEPELAQAVRHRLHAPAAVLAEVRERVAQRRVAVVELVAEHVQVLVLAVDRRELGRGRQAHAPLRRRGQRLGHAVDGVVVGQRQQLDAAARRERDHRGGRERAVGVRRVRLEIECGCRVGCGHAGKDEGDDHSREARFEMSTGLIIAIVVIVLLLVALLVLMPRMRAQARETKARRELDQRRQQAAGEERSRAQLRESRADDAEREARIAQQKAQAERAEASMASERADRHEQGLSDHELVDDHERDRFAGVSGDPRLNDPDRAPSGDTRDPRGIEDERGRADEPRADEPRADERAPRADEPRADEVPGGRAHRAGSVRADDERDPERAEAYEQGRLAERDPDRAEAYDEGRSAEADPRRRA